jgi:hypothetical protein
LDDHTVVEISKENGGFFSPRGSQLPVTDETLRAAGRAASLVDHAIVLI